MKKDVKNVEEVDFAIVETNGMLSVLRKEAEDAATPRQLHLQVKETGPVWICPTYNLQGKAACPSKAIPEPILETIVDEVGGIGKITVLQACDDNTVVLTLCSGEQIVKRWQSRSRRQSWTPEMREAARQRKLRKEVASC